MKTYIIFLALLITNLSFLIYQTDMDDLLLIENDIKTAAEEISYGTVRYFDEALFSEGSYIINRAEAIRWAEYYLSNYTADKSYGGSAVRCSIKNIESKIIVFDDSGFCYIYKEGIETERFEFDYPYIALDDHKYRYSITSPSVIVELNAIPDDVFRLPFIECETIIRSAMYEQKDYK